MSFTSITLAGWDEIHHYAWHGWLYRGQRSAEWELKTSLERCCDRLSVTPAERRKIEEALFREFRRAYHQYARHVPNPKDVVEWLSLMEHHGAPTRLLDFTYSIYVAAYFAIEAAEGDSAVWAVNGPWALQQSAALLRATGKREVNRMLTPVVEGDEEVVQALFLSEPYVRAAWPINPFRLNERLRIQRGTFLIPGDISQSFMANLGALPGHDRRDNIVKIVIPYTETRKALQHLFLMDISRTSLFPGLDGYAQSLGVYHPVFDPVKWA